MILHFNLVIYLDVILCGDDLTGGKQTSRGRGRGRSEISKAFYNKYNGSLNKYWCEPFLTQVKLTFSYIFKTKIT